MTRVLALFLVLASAHDAVADVFDMAGGLTSLNFVTVGNAGNAADTRYLASGFGGVDHIYAIGSYEVTTGQYTEFLNAVAASDPHYLYNTNMWSSNYGCKIERQGVSGSYTYSVAADRANRPVNFVSLHDAARFINWLHNGQGNGDTETGAYGNVGTLNISRLSGAKYWLPTEDEWYKAAFHKNDGITGNYWDYATGSNLTPSNDLIVPDPGNSVNYQNGGLTLGEPYFMTEVGAFANSDSPYGTFDQNGNVREWTETRNSGIPGFEEHWRTRGGFYNDTASMIRAQIISSSHPNSEHWGTGFRVATVPEPGSIVLFSCGVLGGVLLWRRSRHR